MRLFPITKQLIPEGKVVGRQINLARVEIPQLIAKMEQRKFCGYFRFSLPKSEGMVFMQEGKVQAALYEEGSRQTGGVEAYQTILKQAADKQGRMDVSTLDKSMVDGLMALWYGEGRYVNILLRHVQLKSLLSSLQQEKFSGCMKIQVEQRGGLLLFEQGQPSAILGAATEDPKAAQEYMLDLARQPHALLDVYALPSAQELTDQAQAYQTVTQQEAKAIPVALDLSSLID